MISEIQINSSVELESLQIEVKSKLLTLGHLCASEGIQVRLYADTNRPLHYFLSLSEDQQFKLGRAFITYVTACEAEIKSGYSIRDSELRIMWRILKSLGLRPGHEAFAYLTQGHSIEVYNSEFIQVYRNIRFMELCSYSLEEVFTWPLKDLFYRNDEDDLACFQAVSQVLDSNSAKEVVLLPNHYIYERESPENRSFFVEGGVVASLFDTNKKPSGFIACLAAKLVKN